MCVVEIATALIGATIAGTVARETNAPIPGPTGPTNPTPTGPTQPTAPPTTVNNPIPDPVPLVVQEPEPIASTPGLEPTPDPAPVSSPDVSPDRNTTILAMEDEDPRDKRRRLRSGLMSTIKTSPGGVRQPGLKQPGLVGLYSSGMKQVLGR